MKLTSTSSSTSRQAASESEFCRAKLAATLSDHVSLDQDDLFRVTIERSSLAAGANDMCGPVQRPR